MTTGSTQSSTDAQESTIHLSEQHLAALNRSRRVLVNQDAGGAFGGDTKLGDVNKWLDGYLNFADEPGSQIDSIWWCVDEGNEACYPSKVIPISEHPGLQDWLRDGIHIVRLLQEETHRRGLEAFYTYRLNGAWPITPMKEEHPDWVLDGNGAPSWKPWNFAVEGVRDYKLSILRELAENYNFDGMDVDFGRGLCSLPPGQAWEQRDAITDFMRRVRRMLLEVAEKRGRPFLLSTRVAESIPGCHYDGLDVETWARENLVDIFVLGVRSPDVDLAGFRRIVQGRNIKLYPCVDDFHSHEGYFHPPVEYFRGLAANWWHQGADGILTFNFASAPPHGGSMHSEKWAPIGFYGIPKSHQQAYHEIGDPEAIRFEDKLFVVRRRFGGGGCEDRWGVYQIMNIEGPLPAAVSGDDMPTILTVYVADDLAGNEDRVRLVDLRILFSGAAATDEVEVKLNGIQLPRPHVHDGVWRFFEVYPRQFAVGPNLVYVRSKRPMTIEKVEVLVFYEPR